MSLPNNQNRMLPPQEGVSINQQIQQRQAQAEQQRLAEEAAQKQKQTQEVNNRLQTLDTQDTTFGKALMDKTIDQEKYNTAMGFQAQQREDVWSLAAKEGLVSKEVAQQNISDIKSNYQTLLQESSIAVQNQQATQTPEQRVQGLAQQYKSMPLHEQLNPFTALLYLTNTNKAISEVLESRGQPENTLAREVEGFGGRFLVGATETRNFIGNFAGVKPAPIPYTPTTQSARIGGYVEQAIELGLTVLTGVGLANPKTVIGLAKAVATGPLLGAGINVGIGEGYKAITKQPTSTKEILSEAVTGAQFALGTQGLMKGLSAVAVKTMGTPFQPIGRVAAEAAWTSRGRTALFTGLGATVGYAQEPTPEGALKGAGTGLGFAVAGEVLGKVASIRGKSTKAVTPAQTEAKITKLTGGEDTFTGTEMFNRKGDLIESNRTVNVKTETRIIKDASYAKWLKEYNAQFTPEQVEFEGQGKTSYITGETMETTKGATSFKAQPDPFLAVGKKQSYVGTQRFLTNEGIIAERNIVTNKNQVSISNRTQGDFLTSGERETYDMSGVKGRVTTSQSQYHTARIMGNMKPEAYTKMLKSIPAGAEDLPYKQFGGLNAQQLERPMLRELPTSINEAYPKPQTIPVFTNILDLTITEIPAMTRTIPGARVNLFNPTETPLFAVTPSIKQTPQTASEQVQALRSAQLIEQKQEQIQMQTMDTEQSLLLGYRYEQQQEQKPNFGLGNLKVSETPSFLFGSKRRTGVGSVKRQYDILTAEEFLGVKTKKGNKIW